MPGDAAEHARFQSRVAGIRITHPFTPQLRRRDSVFEYSLLAGVGKRLEIAQSSDRVDLLFSDIVMPAGINGIQLAGEARRVQPTP
jgi:hypothetical protein